MRVHSERLSGTQFIPVNVFEGELPLMLFSLPLRSKSISELSLPARHTGAKFLRALAVTHKAPGQQKACCGGAAADVRQRQSGWLAVLNLICPPLGNLSLELIVNPIKAGNTAYWFTPLNTHNKQIHWEYITCKSTHKWFSPPQNIHINYSSSCHYAGVVGEKQLVLTLS